MGKNLKLIVIIAVLVGLGFLVAAIYYRNLNRSEDPRVLKARLMLADYDKMMKAGSFLEVFPLLDTVEAIFQRTHGYEGSFEFGVIENNRASAFIMRALYDSLLVEGEKEKLLNLARAHLGLAIVNYKHWLDSVNLMSKDDIRSVMERVFLSPDCDLDGISPEKVINKRVKDIEFARIETKRRMSVAFTNLGIVQRHTAEPDSAVVSYTRALELWPDNHQAKSNIDVLLGKEPRKRNFIQKLFPPDRTKED